MFQNLVCALMRVRNVKSFPGRASVPIQLYTNTQTFVKSHVDCAVGANKNLVVPSYKTSNMRLQLFPLVSYQ